MGRAEDGAPAGWWSRLPPRRRIGLAFLDDSQRRRCCYVAQADRRCDWLHVFLCRGGEVWRRVGLNRDVIASRAWLTAVGVRSSRRGAGRDDAEDGVVCVDFRSSGFGGGVRTRDAESQAMVGTFYQGTASYAALTDRRLRFTTGVMSVIVEAWVARIATVILAQRGVCLVTLTQCRVGIS